MKCQRAPLPVVSWSNLRLLSVVTSTSLPLCPLPFNSLILLVIWSVSPTRHPSTNHLSSSEQWTIQASNLRKNWQNREGTPTIPNVSDLLDSGEVSMCVCDVIGVREKLALCLAAGCWWTLNSIAQRHILSNRTLHNVTLSRGHHQLSSSNQIYVYPMSFPTVSHFVLPFLFLLQK